MLVGYAASDAVCREVMRELFETDERFEIGPPIEVEAKPELGALPAPHARQEGARGQARTAPGRQGAQARRRAARAAKRAPRRRPNAGKPCTKQSARRAEEVVMLDTVIRGGTVVDGTGAPATPGRRRHSRRPDRRDRHDQRRSRRDDRRRRPRRRARIRRPAHALRRAAVLGPGGHAVEPARRDQHDRRQLRVHARARRSRRRRLPAPHDGEGRRHAAARARDGRAVVVALVRRVPRRASTTASASTSASSSATARCGAT